MSNVKSNLLRKNISFLSSVLNKWSSVFMSVTHLNIIIQLSHTTEEGEVEKRDVFFCKRLIVGDLRPKNKHKLNQTIENHVGMSRNLCEA